MIVNEIVVYKIVDFLTVDVFYSNVVFPNVNFVTGALTLQHTLHVKDLQTSFDKNPRLQN